MWSTFRVTLPICMSQHGAMIKCHVVFTQEIFFYGSGGGKSRMEVTADSVPCKASLSSLWTVIFSLHLHMLFLCLLVKSERVHGTLVTTHKDTSLIKRGPHPYDHWTLPPNTVTLGLGLQHMTLVGTQFSPLHHPSTSHIRIIGRDVLWSLSGKENLQAPL